MGSEPATSTSVEADVWPELLDDTARQPAAKTPEPCCSVWLLLLGIVLSCTGVGAILGIPLIIAALAMPKLAPRLATATKRGRAAIHPRRPRLSR